MQEVFEKIKERVCEFIHVRNKSGSAPCKNQRASCLQLIRVCDLTAIINQVAEEYNEGWIPVSEPPKKDGFYVVTFDGELCGEDTTFVGMCEFEDGDWMEDCVLAWKKQAPYKPEGE